MRLNLGDLLPCVWRLVRATVSTTVLLGDADLRVGHIARVALEEVLLPLLEVALGHGCLIATRELVAVLLLHAQDAFLEASSELLSLVPVLVHGGPTCEERVILWVVPLVAHGVGLVERGTRLALEQSRVEGLRLDRSWLRAWKLCKEWLVLVEDRLVREAAVVRGLVV